MVDLSTHLEPSGWHSRCYFSLRMRPLELGALLVAFAAAAARLAAADGGARPDEGKRPEPGVRRPTAERRAGVYFLESFGVGRARGALAPMVGGAIHARIGVGARWRFLAVEPWISSDMQWDREGAWRGFIGGEPAAGRADLEYYGIDAKLVAPLFRGPSGERLEGYVRGGGRLVGATGALDGYSGHGVGAAAGFQLVGRVRALGFLWTPLFFVKRGPKVTGALFIEQGWELVTLRRGGDRISAAIGHVGVGFGLGSRF